MQTRVVFYKEENYLQHFLNGNWATIRKTTMTPDLEAPPAPGLSGSHNVHARKAPSASERWTECTASIAFEAANMDKVFVTALGKVRDLAEYLRSIEDELHPHEIEALGIIERMDAGKLRLRDLTEGQKKAILKSESKKDTREGTRAHDFAAQLFAGTKKVEDLPEEFQEHVGGYVEHCLSLVPGGQHWIESIVPLWYSPGDTGTLDFGAFDEDEDPEVFYLRDLKWGVGKLVRNVENTQFAIYIRSKIEVLEAQRIEDGLGPFSPDMVINAKAYQPRHREAADLTPWITTWADLKAFTKRIEDAARKIDAGTDLVFAPSDDTCQWCPCRGFCEARSKAATEALNNPDMTSSADELLALLPDDDEIPGHKPRTKTSLNKLDPLTRTQKRFEFVAGLLGEDMSWALGFERMVRLWSKKKVITSILDDVGEYLRDEMLAGNKEVAEFLKLVESREGNRAWINEADAMKLLKQKLKIDDYAPRKIVSPTAAEEMLKLDEQSTKFQNLFRQKVSRASGGKTIATLDDKRPAIQLAIDMLPDEAETFDDEDDGLGSED